MISFREIISYITNNPGINAWVISNVWVIDHAFFIGEKTFP